MIFLSLFGSPSISVFAVEPVIIEEHRSHHAGSMEENFPGALIVNQPQKLFEERELPSSVQVEFPIAKSMTDHYRRPQTRTLNLSAMYRTHPARVWHIFRS